MSIDRYSQPTTADLYPSANGKYVKYDDHHNEVIRLKEIINNLYDQLSEISTLKAMVDTLKPTENSKFVVMYKTESGGYDYTLKYQRWFKHAVERVNQLQKDPDVFDVKAFALTEVPIVESLTIQLPE
jgi:hypothetical protein